MKIILQSLRAERILRSLIGACTAGSNLVLAGVGVDLLGLRSNLRRSHLAAPITLLVAAGGVAPTGSRSL